MYRYNNGMTNEPARHPTIPIGIREVRAAFTERTITVYQAYSSAIADAALRAGTFVAPFKRDRMTWIKPSFRWMMYRSGWATKPGQERILAVEITREGFEWALTHSAVSQHDLRGDLRLADWRAEMRRSPVRVQWDPERSVTLAPLDHRAIQIGLSGDAVARYLDDWIVEIVDVTPRAVEVHRLVEDGDLAAAQAALPVEHPYPLPAPIRQRIGADPS